MVRLLAIAPVPAAASVALPIAPVMVMAVPAMPPVLLVVMLPSTVRAEVTRVSTAAAPETWPIVDACERVSDAVAVQLMERLCQLGVFVPLSVNVQDAPMRISPDDEVMVAPEVVKVPVR